MSRNVVSIALIWTGLTLAGCAGGGASTEPPESLGQSQYAPAPLPRGALGLYVEGVLARSAGDDDRAFDLLRDAVGRDNRLIMANQVLGEMYVERGDPSNARGHYETLVRLDPETAENHVRLGYTQELLQQFNEAAQSYLRGLSLDSTSAAGNVGLGRTYLALGRPAEARPYLETATRLNPDDGQAWLNLGRSLDALGALGAAETAYRRALEALPEPTPDLIENLGVNLVNQGRGDEAVPLLERVIERGPTAAAHKNLGDAHVVERRYDEALTEYDAALALDADYVPALNAKGTTFILQYQQGASLDDALRQRALELWRRSLEIDPEQPRVREAITRFEGGEGLFN